MSDETAAPFVGIDLAEGFDSTAIWQRCSRCHGAGWLRVDEPECNGGRTAEPCERCGGMGRELEKVIVNG